MEAGEYLTTYEELHKEGHEAGHLHIRLRDPCAVGKVVWSSFDFMSGPELRFVWEVSPSTSLSPMNLSGEEGSVITEAESLDSSVSAKSVPFEDIDDPLRGDVSLAAEMMESVLLAESDYGNFCSHLNEPIFANSPQFLDDYMRRMNDSRISNAFTNSTLESDETSRLYESFTTTSTETGKSTDNLRIPSEKGSASSTDTTHAASPQDVQSGTPTECLDFSKLLDSSNDRQQAEFDINARPLTAYDSTMSPNRTQTPGCSFSRFSEQDEVDGDYTDRGESAAADHRRDPNGLTASCVDSGIGGTISTHSELSNMCQSPLGMETSFRKENISALISRSRTSSRSRSSDGMTSLLDLSLDSPEDSVTDEIFVSKFVLAEQICSTQLPSNPLMHKLTTVPSRRLLVGSYIFSSDMRDGRKTIHAVSLLLNDKRSEWYMSRQEFFETFFMDFVPTIKASLLTEDLEDSIVRITSELHHLLGLISALERFSLVTNNTELQIKNTLFAEKRSQEDKVLARAISGTLQSQGHCVIIGSNHLYVSKLLYTLALFVPSELRAFCLRPYRHRYSPYLRLQAVRRAEFSQVMHCGIGSVWPMCVVDVDRATVCMSAPYSRHRVMRSRSETMKLKAILNQHESSLRDRKSVKLELSSCRVLDCVKLFLRRVDLLPMEESARHGFANQLMLYIDNLAHALITYIKDSSVPLNGEKASATKSSRFSLSETRKALDLQSDAWFHVILARADLLHHDLAEFIFSSA